jgi:signal transduction histidine kinase
MSPRTIDAALYRWRYIAILASFAFLAYCNLYMWFFIPYADFRYAWDRGQLRVLEIDESSPAAAVLQIDDRIDAIEGRQTITGRTIFPLPEKMAYTLDILRGDQAMTVEVPFPAEPGPYAMDYRLPAGLLSLALWLIGPLALLLARQDNTTAIRVGYIFMLGGVIVMGIQGFVTGVPGAWLAGTPLAYLGAVSLVYLGFVPRAEPLPARARAIFKIMVTAAVTLGLLAVLEGLFLYPQRLSVLSLTGFSLYQSGILSLGLGLLACFVILLVRAIRMPASYLRQQLLVLLLFLALGVLPATLLTFIPQFLFGANFLPFPISIALSILFPLGYFYVIFRKGYLGLDILFNKMTTLIILMVMTIAFYGTLLLVLENWLRVGDDSIVFAAVALVPIIMLLRLADNPIDTAVQGILFGPAALHTDAQLPAIASQLSLKPELTTLKAVVESIAADFNVPLALLALKDAESILMPTVQVGVQDWRLRPLREISAFFKPVIRSAVSSKEQLPPLLAEYGWMEVIVPIILRDDQIGFLALARPADGYFNARQVRFLSRAADMIAIGSEAIFLFEASRRLSQELLKTQEAERRRLASEIHDNPLQTLGFVKREMHRIAGDIEEPSPAAARDLLVQAEYLQETIIELRNVCTGLYPAVIDKGFQMIATALANEFGRQHGLLVVLNVDRRVPDETSEADSEAATALFYVLREALNNVVKHAQVDEACVEMDYRNGFLSLVVSDNGVGGYPPSQSRSDLLKGGKIGIVNMYERAESVGGRLNIEPNEPQGTRVLLEMPLSMGLGTDDANITG